MEEFLDYISKLKRMYSCALHWKLRIDSPNHKESIDAIRDEVHSMARQGFENSLILRLDRIL